MQGNQTQNDVYPLLNQKHRKYSDAVLWAHVVPKAKAYKYLHDSHI